MFARGFAVALAKKLSLMGSIVWLRFLDSRMHRRVPAAALGGPDMPYLLFHHAVMVETGTVRRALEELLQG